MSKSRQGGVCGRFGRLCRQARQAQKLKLRQVAGAAGTASYMSEVERGKRKAPRNACAAYVTSQGYDVDPRLGLFYAYLDNPQGLLMPMRSEGEAFLLAQQLIPHVSQTVFAWTRKIAFIERTLTDLLEAPPPTPPEPPEAPGDDETMSAQEYYVRRQGYLVQAAEHRSLLSMLAAWCEARAQGHEYEAGTPPWLTHVEDDCPWQLCAQGFGLLWAMRTLKQDELTESCAQELAAWFSINESLDAAYGRFVGGAEMLAASSAALPRD